VLRHVSILKLAEEEARTLVGEPDETRSARSACRRSWSRSAPRLARAADGKLRAVPAQAAGEVDPTGAGDASAVYRFALERHAPVPPRESDRARSGCWRAGSREGARQTVDGVFEVDLAEEEVSAPSKARSGGAAESCRSSSPVQPPIHRGRRDRQAPALVVSNDAGRTWRGVRRGLPPGRAVAAPTTTPT
jgi:hypothetical protein